MTRHDVSLHTLQLHSRAMPIKHHYLQEWAALRGWRQSDVLKRLDAIGDKSVNKSLVSRWWKGMLPGDEYLERLAGVFDLPKPELLLRHPTEIWALHYAEELNDNERAAVQGVIDTYKKTGTE